MNTPHTPGPWEIIYSRDDDEEVSPWGCIEVADKRYITVEGRSGDEAQANARLISAAPELLSACEEALNSHSALTERVELQLRAAIAKATEGE